MLRSRANTYSEVRILDLLNPLSSFDIKEKLNKTLFVNLIFLCSVGLSYFYCCIYCTFTSNIISSNLICVSFIATLPLHGFHWLIIYRKFQMVKWNTSFAHRQGGRVGCTFELFHVWNFLLKGDLLRFSYFIYFMMNHYNLGRHITQSEAYFMI